MAPERPSPGFVRFSEGTPSWVSQVQCEQLEQLE